MNKVKKALREKLKMKRSQICAERREEASTSFFLHFSKVLASSDNVLSFASFGCELDTSLLNHYLARTERLFLPKMEGTCLEIYRVMDLKKDLLVNSYGILEPNPKRCQKSSKNLISIALIPGLGFDKRNYRMGYGMGFYDRFLPDMKARTIGIGFHEQLVDRLPCEKTDHPLTDISLF